MLKEQRLAVIAYSPTDLKEKLKKEVDDLDIECINLCDKDCEECEEPCEDRCDDCKFDQCHTAEEKDEE